MGTNVGRLTTRCQSVECPSSDEYMHIGLAKTRFPNSTPRRVSGSKILVLGPPTSRVLSVSSVPMAGLLRGMKSVSEQGHQSGGRRSLVSSRSGIRVYSSKRP